PRWRNPPSLGGPALCPARPVTFSGPGGSQCYDTRRRRTVTMEHTDWLNQQFEQHRSHLRAVAYRMLGSLSDADDAVQDAWLRFSRADTSDVENLRAWLTTVVSRVSLNMLRS